MKRILHSFFVVLALLVVANCHLGVDVSTLITANTYSCIKSSGYSFVSVRGYHSYGAIDTNAVAGLQNARQAGLSTDVYLFPCRSKNAAAQVNQMINGIPANLYGTVWLDVETNTSPNCGWSTDHNSNCNFVGELVNAVKARGKKVGIYASSYMWTQIFGSTTACQNYKSEPLWYAHYDHVQSFSDFKEFGGWTKPSIKQYAGTSAVCGASVDLNYYP